MFSSVSLIVITGVVLLLLLTLYRIEDVRGKRIFLSKVRAGADRLVEYISFMLVSSTSYFLGRSIKFLLHHGVQNLLKKSLRLVRSVELRLEYALRQNKNNRRSLSKEHVRTHLDDIADHKVSSALTEKQKQEMRSH